MQFTMADAYSLNTGKIFGELMKGTRAERIAAYQDPEWRARAAADLEESPMKPRWETFEVSDYAETNDLFLASSTTSSTTSTTSCSA